MSSGSPRHRVARRRSPHGRAITRLVPHGRAITRLVPHGRAITRLVPHGRAIRRRAITRRSMRGAPWIVALAVLGSALSIGTLWAVLSPSGASFSLLRRAFAPNPAWATTPTWSVTLPDAHQPVALSSPIVADLGGAPAAVVGDRHGSLYALRLANGFEVAGWPTSDGSGPIDSTPSVVPMGGGQSSIAVGSGNDADPASGGYQAFGPTGTLRWFTPVVNPPTDGAPAGGVQAGLAVGSLQGGGPDVVAGSLGQVGYALNAGNGTALSGWPFFNSDSTHATAALADLYGNGKTEVIEGGDQTAGMARGQQYTNGGHLRILSAHGNQICRADTNQVVDSSPAVGGFLAGGATGIVVGTGGYFAGASDTNTLQAYNTQCQLQWSATLDGSTFSSPALADIVGNGSLQVAEGTDQGPGKSGSVWVLDASTGQTIWKQTGIGRVVGSVVTADLFGNGYQDVIVPTVEGTIVFDGRTGARLADLSPTLGLQNAPLVTNDPNGTVGITLAGYSGAVQPNGIGVVVHYEIPGSNGALAVGPGSWPMFHQNPQLTGDAGGGVPPRSAGPCAAPAATTSGYDLVASDGGVFSFGNTPFCGSMGAYPLNSPIVGIAMAPNTGGYWLVAADGGVFAIGQARFYGSMGASPLNSPVVGMAATPDGRGYWLVAADGGVFAFGDASFFGSMGGQRLNAPIVGISSSTDGGGYRMVAADGGVFAFGDAPFFGSMGGQRLNAPIVATVNDANTGGYWEVASDGGIFSFGGAPFFGSAGGIHLNAPIVGMGETSDGTGYRLASSDGGIFAFGTASFDGSMGGATLNRPIVAVAGF